MTAPPRIRHYRPADRPRLYRICLLTGDGGTDASGRYADPALLGHIYLGPYLALAPHLAFVAEGAAGAPVGYAVGSADTAAFESACEQEWWPALRARYPDPGGPPAGEYTPDQQLVQQIHRPPRGESWLVRDYPGHLHINLLPAAQRQGTGRTLMNTLLAALARAGATGVHLGVDPRNHRAIGFYRRLGFRELSPSLLGTHLPPHGTAPSGGG